jgi:TetR/AcrR family transcriptional regulator
MALELSDSVEKVASNSAQRILETAEQIFAKSGFVGTRVDEIARAAAINKRMIYYHFRSKEGLYQAVLEKNLVPLLEMSRNLLREGLHPAEMYRRLLDTYFDFLASHRLYVRLISWEILGRNSRLSSLGMRRQTFDEVVKYFEQAQGEGALRADVAVRDVVMAGLMLCFCYFSQMQFMQDFYPCDLDDPEQFARWKASVLALILEGSRLQGCSR